MKKNRPAVLLTCMCRPAQKHAMTKLIFKHTTTLGVREYLCARQTLERDTYILGTKHGDVRVKTAIGYGVKRQKPEYDDVAKIAREKNMSIAEVMEILDELFRMPF